MKNCLNEVVRLDRWGPVCSCTNVKNCVNAHTDNSSETNDEYMVNNEHMPPQPIKIEVNNQCNYVPEVLYHTDPVSTLSFEGLNHLNTGFFNPFSSIAVGPDYIIQSAGTAISIFDKFGFKLATFGLTFMFDNSILGETTAVLYDPYSDRYMVAANKIRNIGESAAMNIPYVALAVSRGNNPIRDGWHTYLIPIESERLEPHNISPFRINLGSWHNGIYMSVFCYSRLVGVAGGFSRISIINRESIIRGKPFIALYQDIYSQDYIVNGVPTFPIGIMPPNANVSLPPLDENGYFIDFAVTNQDVGPGTIVFWEININWLIFKGKSRRTYIAVDNYLSGSNVSNQKDTPVKVVYGFVYNSGIQTQAQYSRVDDKSSYWIATTNIFENYNGVIWFQISISPTGPHIAQQQTILDKNGFGKFSASIAVNKAGNAVLACTSSSSSTFPSTVYYYRFNTDPINLMTNENVIIKGTGSNTHITYSPDLATWGYNSIQIDPTDTTTFFICGQWYKTTSNNDWYTTISNLKL